ncbi:hypothetical protein LINPERHAP1_LOCUS21125 [Linum perenne]
MGGLSKFFVDLEAGYHKFILQLDSLDAISFLTGKGDPIHQHETEGAQYQDLCKRIRMVTVRHKYREGNHASDYLASIGYDYPFGFHMILVSNYNLGHFLLYDYMGISEPCMICIND